MMSCPEAMGWDSWVFWKKKCSELRFETGRSELRFGSRGVQLGLGGAPRIVGSDGTVIIVKIMSLSSRVENLKVKKVFKVSYLNQESCQCFECFSGFLCVWTFYASEYFGGILQYEDGGSTIRRYIPCNWPQDHGKESSWIGNQRQNQDHLDLNEAQSARAGVYTVCISEEE